MRALLDAGGWLHYAWVVPGFFFMLLFVLVYLRFFWHLNPPFKALFWVSGLLYVGGAMGMELLGGYQADFYGTDTPAYVLIVTTEETLEMSGIVVFLYTLLKYLSRVTPDVHLCIK